MTGTGAHSVDHDNLAEGFGLWRGQYRVDCCNMYNIEDVPTNHAVSIRV